MGQKSIRSGKVKRVVLPDGGKPVLVEAETIDGLLSWGKFFGNEKPVEVEVGFGKGRFLLETAVARREINFLGIEVARKYLEFVAWRTLERGLENVRLIQGEGESVFHHIPEATVQACYILFPDPWPKRRHNKRRLVQPPFIDTLVRSLKPGGRIHFVTDFREYHEAVLPIFAGREDLAPMTGELAERWIETLTPSGYEMKYRTEGRPIHRTVWVRTCRP